MAHLFSPITIARTRLENRIVMAPLSGGYATLDGFVEESYIEYYAQRASGGVGLIITEPMRVVYPDTDQTRSHVGIYCDLFVPNLLRLTRVIHDYGTKIMALLDAPDSFTTKATPHDLRRLTERFILAAWRALAAGFDGVMLSAADGGALHALVSPLTNHRFDEYGKTIDGRLRMPMDILESIRDWIGKNFLLGFRLVAEEFEVGGMTLQDARVIARRMVGSGANLLDVTADIRHSDQVARFPGWCVPLANSVKRFMPDIPVIGSGLLGEPHLADSIVREGSVDLVMLGNTLRTNPTWPQLARSFLLHSEGT